MNYQFIVKLKYRRGGDDLGGGRISVVSEDDMPGLRGIRQIS